MTSTIDFDAPIHPRLGSVNNMIEMLRAEFGADPNASNWFYGAGYGDIELKDIVRSLSRHVRNQYDLWSMEWKPEIGEMYGCECDVSPYHPDALSATIVKEAWLRGPIKKNGNTKT